MSLKLGNTNIAGTQILYSTTGNNTDGAMTQSATTSALNTKSNDIDVVHKTGNEIISGTKVFTDEVRLPVTTTLAKENREYEGGQLFFERGQSCTLLDDVCVDLYGNTIRVLSRDSGGNIHIPLQVDLERNCCFSEPSELGGSVVVTTVVSKGNSTGYMKLGNGFIIQWGDSQSNIERSFLIPFTLMPVISGLPGVGDSALPTCRISKLSETSFKLYNNDGWNMRWIAVGF